MIILNENQYLSIALTSATTGSVSIFGTFTDTNGTVITRSNQLTKVTDTTNTKVVDSPGLAVQRDLGSLFIHNDSSTAVSLTLYLYDNYAARVVFATTLKALGTLEFFNSTGWTVVSDASVGTVGFTLNTTAPISGGAAVTLGGSVTVAHNTSGVSAATYGSTGYVPYFTVDAYGHLTSATNRALVVSDLPSNIPNANLQYSSFTINGTTNQVNVSTSPVSLGGSTTLSLPQNIHTGASPTFTGLTLSATLNNSAGYTQTGTSTNTFSGATTFSATGTALTVTNNVQIWGLMGLGRAIGTNPLTIQDTASDAGILIRNLAGTSFTRLAFTGDNTYLDSSAGSIIFTIGGSGKLTVATSLVSTNQQFTANGITSYTGISNYITSGDSVISSTTVAGGDALLRTTASAGYYRGLQLSSASLRWWVASDNVAESGSNVGGDFFIARYDDTGGYLGLPIVIKRSTGAVTVENLTGTGTRLTLASSAGLLSALTLGTTSQYLRGDNSYQTLDTSVVAENTNLYFTNARAIASTLTGYTSGAGTISSADTILSAIQKLNGNVGALTTGVSSVFGRTGAVVATSGDYTTAQVTEVTNLYYTDARARAAISGTTPISYSSSTGVISVADGAIANVKLANSSITINGTTNQVNVSTSPVSLGGSTTISLPQNIHTTAFPTFGGLTLNLVSSDTSLFYITNIGGNTGRGTLGIPFYAPHAPTINRNPHMLYGTNGYGTYDNSAGGHTTIASVADATAGTASGSILRISYDGTGTANLDPTPGFGGFYISIGALSSQSGFGYRGGNRYLITLRAKIPVGRSIYSASNSFGTNTSFNWITPVAGTGEYETYKAIQVTDSAGTLSQTGYWYIDGGSNSAFTWDVALCQYQDLNVASDQWQASLMVGYASGKNLDYGDLYVSGTTTLGSLSGVLKASSGVVSGSATTSDLTEGSNLYYTDARARAAISATSPVSYNNSTGVISMAAASTSVNGYLTSTDWNTFNNKEGAITAGTTSQYWRGDKTFQTLNQAAVAGLTTASSPSFAGLTLTGYATLHADPSSALHAATKQYVDAVATGVRDFKESVRVVSLSNITLSGTQTIDGVSVIAGDRVLVAGQTTGADNGIYICSASGWSRSTDADTDAEVTAGIYTFVSEGTTYSDSSWVLTTNDPITVGVTSLSFVQFSGAGQITAGAGLTKTGNILDVGTASSSRIVVNTDNIDLATTAISAGDFNYLTIDAYGRATAGYLRTLTAPTYGISVTNGSGAAGNPTLALTNDLAALEALGSTGFAVRTTTDTWAQRTLTGTTNQVSITYGDGVSGNPTFSLPQSIHTAATPTFAGLVIAGGSSPQAGTIVWGDNTGWNLDFGTMASSVFALRFRMTDSGIFTATNSIGAGTGTNMGGLFSGLGYANGAAGVFHTTTSGVASVGAFVNDGTQNSAVKLFMDYTNNVWGLAQSYSSGGTPFVLYNNGATRLRVETNGNLMVGYTSDFGYKLSVNGAFYSASSIYTAANLALGNGSANANISIAGQAFAYGDATTNFVYAGSSGGSFNIVTYTGASSIAVFDNATKQASFYGSLNIYAGAIYYAYGAAVIFGTYDNNSLVFHTNATARGGISADGKWLVASTVDIDGVSKLQVNGSTYLGGLVKPTIAATNGVAQNSIVGAIGSDVTLGALGFEIGGVTSATASERYGYFGFGDNYAMRPIAIGTGSAGNSARVMIGSVTDDATNILQVTGTTRTTTLKVGTNSAPRQANFGNTGAGSYAAFIPASGNQFTVGADAGGFIVYDDAASDYLFKAHTTNGILANRDLSVGASGHANHLRVWGHAVIDSYLNVGSGATGRIFNVGNEGGGSYMCFNPYSGSGRQTTVGVDSNGFLVFDDLTSAYLFTLSTTQATLNVPLTITGKTIFNGGTNWTVNGWAEQARLLGGGAVRFGAYSDGSTSNYGLGNSGGTFYAWNTLADTSSTYAANYWLAVNPSLAQFLRAAEFTSTFLLSGLAGTGNRVAYLDSSGYVTRSGLDPALLLTTTSGLQDPGANGVVVRTAAGVTTARTLTGTSNQITISNGDGVSGNPTFSTPQDLATTSNVVFGTVGAGGAPIDSIGIMHTTTSGVASVGAYVNDGVRNSRVKLFMDQTTNTWGLHQTYTSGTTPFVLYQNGAEQLRLITNGNLMVGYTSDQGYKLAVNGTGYFAGSATFESGSAVISSGDFYGGGVSNLASGNNAYIQTSTVGTIISRNVADANVALIVKQTHASSTGNILEARNNSITVLSVSQGGNTTIAGYVAANQVYGYAGIVNYVSSGDSAIVSQSIAGGQALVKADAATSQYTGFQTLTAATLRWFFGQDNGTQSGSNAGADFFVARYNDAGSYLGIPFAINRANGNITIAGTIGLNGRAYGTNPLSIQDSADDAGILIRNSAGTSFTRLAFIGVNTYLDSSGGAVRLSIAGSTKFTVAASLVSTNQAFTADGLISGGAGANITGQTYSTTGFLVNNYQSYKSKNAAGTAVDLFYLDNSNTFQFNAASGTYYAWGINATDYLRLSATGLAVGASSNANYRLDVIGPGSNVDAMQIQKGSGEGGLRFSYANANHVSYIRTYEDSTNSYMHFGVASGTSTTVSVMKLLGDRTVQFTGYGTGVAKFSSTGVVSSGATTSDLPEGSNQYYTDARATAALAANYTLSFMFMGA